MENSSSVLYVLECMHNFVYVCENLPKLAKDRRVLVKRQEMKDPVSAMIHTDRIVPKLQVRRNVILLLYINHTSLTSCTPVRACRNAIEFNSIPSINRLVPGGYESLKLDVLLAVPPKYRDSLDLNRVQAVFPYGSVRFQIQDGGMIAPSGIAIDKLGDTNDDMVVVCCSVSVGY
eukprot:scaffold1869_cov122-Cylindrotheca_fusiformis.AAC.53